jgi:hypothetical protein
MLLHRFHNWWQPIALAIEIERRFIAAADQLGELFDSANGPATAFYSTDPAGGEEPRATSARRHNAESITANDAASLVGHRESSLPQVQLPMDIRTQAQEL